MRPASGASKAAAKTAAAATVVRRLGALPPDQSKDHDMGLIGVVVIYGGDVILSDLLDSDIASNCRASDHATTRPYHNQLGGCAARWGHSNPQISFSIAPHSVKRRQNARSL